MKKIYIFSILFLIFIISITVIGSSMVTGSKKVYEEKDILVMQGNREVYFNVYGYSIDNPNVIINPYGNSPLTATVMFETDKYSEASITIKGKNGASDINYVFEKDKYHLIPIYGLYADYENVVVIRSEGKENVINIKTDKLPEDFEFVENNSNGNFMFYNSNYPYAIDSAGNVRWYLNRNYYGNITLLDNSSIIIGSDKYTESGNTISLYKMNLLGKIYDEYLLDGEYYGYSALIGDDILVLSDKVMMLDSQTGEVIYDYGNNDGYDYLGVLDDSVIVRREDIYYKLDDGELMETHYTVPDVKGDFYNNTSNYKIAPASRFGDLKETKVSNKNVSLFKYDKVKKIQGINIVRENNRLKVINERDNDDEVYVILDKVFDKRVYEVQNVKYINFSGLKGKYTIYFLIDDDVYMTDYYISV